MIQSRHHDFRHPRALANLKTRPTACGFPLIGRRATTGRSQSRLIFYSQHVGTGVLLATAFVHLLPTAFESLTDPCLPEFFSKGYKPLPGLIGMVSAIIVVGVESYLTARGAGHSHSHSHAAWQELEGEDHDDHHGMNGLADRRSHRLDNLAVSDPDAEAAQGLVTGASPLPGSTPTTTQPRKHSLDNAFADGDSDLDLDLDELDPVPNGNGSGRYATLKRGGSGGGGGRARADSSSLPPQTPEQQKRQMLQCLLLEAGILFHSVFIGMALSVATGPAFVVFLIAISFHQSFEGLALGSRIAAIQFPRASPRPWLMVLAYGVTTPIGQAIGLFMHRIYDPASMAGLITVGFMNAISAGLLLYSGLVQLLAEDFLSEKSFKILKGRKRLHAYLCVVAGATLMALVGAFA